MAERHRHAETILKIERILAASDHLSDDEIEAATRPLLDEIRNRSGRQDLSRKFASAIWEYQNQREQVRDQVAELRQLLPDDKKNAWGLGELIFQKRTGQKPTGRIRAEQKEAYLIITCERRQDYDAMQLGKKAGTKRIDPSGGSMHRAMTYDVAEGIDHLPVLFVMGFLRDRDHRAVIDHERQHFINDTILDSFSQTEAWQSEQDSTVEGMTETGRLPWQCQRNIKNEILAYVREGVAANTIIRALNADLYSNLFKDLTNDERIEAKTLIRLVAQAMNDCVLFQHGSHERALLVNQLLDIPFDHFPQWLRRIDRYYRAIIPTFPTDLVPPPDPLNPSQPDSAPEAGVEASLDARTKIKRSFFQRLRSGGYGDMLKIVGVVYGVLGVGVYESKQHETAVTVGLDNLWVGLGLLPGPAEQLAVDGFDEFGYQAEHLRQSFDLVFGPQMAHGGVSRISRTDQHISIRSDYHPQGRQDMPMETGHCTWSPGRTPSEIVITADGLTHEEADPTHELLSLITHEGAHALLDPVNATAMPTEDRETIERLLLDRVRGGQDTLYTYVNNFDRSHESIRATELLASLIEEIASMPVDANPIVAGMPWQIRIARQLAINHDTTSDQVQAEIHILERIALAVGDIRYFDKMQQGYRLAYQRLDQDRIDHAKAHDRQRPSTYATSIKPRNVSHRLSHTHSGQVDRHHPHR